MTPQTPQASVIIPACNEGRNLVDTVECVLQNSGEGLLEVIVADDGSTDDSIRTVQSELAGAPVQVVPASGGVARSRNAGARAAKGSVLVFLDGHCYVPPGWLSPLLSALSGAHTGLAGPAFTNIRDTRMKACGVTWRDVSLGNVWLPCGEGVYPVPFHIGACQAVRADVFWEVGGYDDGMTRWGSEDVEMCLRMWLFGYSVVAQPASLVYHLFRTSRPYSVNHCLIMYNHLRMAMLHFDELSLQKVIAQMRSYRDMEKTLVMALTGSTWKCRKDFFARRQRSFEWFCQHFDIAI